MLSLTRKIDYALVALAYLGQRQAQDEASASARQIAEEYGLPLPMLMNLLKELTRAGIISSTRGVHGGYALAQEASRVMLLDVIQAVEGPMKLVPCADRPESQPDTGCTLSSRCPIREPIRRLQERITDFLSEVSLADLIDSKVHVTVGHLGTLT